MLYKICDDEGIKYKPEKKIKLTQKKLHGQDKTYVDVFIEPNICLEADGDCWHANPNPYKKGGSNRPGIKSDTVLVASERRRTKRIAKDVIDKYKGITRDLESQGYKVLRFWGSDLLHDTEKCRQQIVDAVRKSP
ncbi:MAG: DUF559 domain-containing protein [Thaumarchaeota archaeon]|nr:DUF559 domain-containing protein [Nitrososphaerota archaeon]